MKCELYGDNDHDRMIKLVPEKLEMWKKTKCNSMIDSTLDYQISHTNYSNVF